MAENAIYTVQENRLIARDVLEMKLAGPTGSLTAPGQFVNVRLPGFYLRRPISVCRWDEESLTLVYKVVGGGTARLARFGKGTELELLCGLGHGFSLEEAEGKKTVLVGGGVGTPPLYALAQRLAQRGSAPVVALGFASAVDVFYKEEFEKLGCRVLVATEDGTEGVAGFVTTALQTVDYEYYYTCGPKAMMKAVYVLSGEKNARGQLSFEERMGCGFGACMGCSCKTMLGPKRVCVDGPVFYSREVVFE